mgnify:CR=1 FL=1
MNRVSSVFKAGAGAAKAGVQTAVESDANTKLRQLGKFVHDNAIPRYILYGLIMTKTVLIYDKLKQIVALN